MPASICLCVALPPSALSFLLSYSFVKSAALGFGIDSARSLRLDSKFSSFSLSSSSISNDFLLHRVTESVSQMMEEYNAVIYLLECF